MAITERKHYGMCNPVISKMANKTQGGVHADGTSATYKGIISKTLFFMVLCVAGVIAFFALHGTLTGNAEAIPINNISGLEGIVSLKTSPQEALVFVIAAAIVLFAPLIAWLIRPIIPAVGVLYALCEGYFMGMITQALLPEYKWISLTAFILTIAVVAVMLFLYKKQIIKVSGKFKTVIFTLFLSGILGGLLLFILGMIPAISPIVSGITSFMGSPVVSIVLSAVYLVIAILFLLVDFDVIRECVEEKMPKKYEWMAAFGLTYTIIYIYFKILSLIIRIAGASKNKD